MVVWEKGKRRGMVRRRRCLAMAFWLVAGPWGGSLGASSGEEPRPTGFGQSQVYSLVESLVREVGPRFAGSPGDSRAVAWAVTTLQKLGFDRVVAEPVRVPRWVRGEAAVELLSPWPQPLVAVSLGGSVGTPGEGVEAEVVGVLNVAALEKLPSEAVRGKIVFLTQRMVRTSDGSGYGEVVPNRTRGAVEAARKGARAVVLRSTGTSEARFAHTGAMRYEAGVERIPAFALAHADADLLEAALGTGQPVRLKVRSSAREEGEVESANVLGEVRGRERPEEIVLVGAHLDSWDLSPSANDDAAGVAIAIEAARRLLLEPVRPRRTVRVVLFANEEFGLSGARAYLDAHRGELPQHMAALEADLGSGRVLAFRSRVADADRAAVAELAQELSGLGIPWKEEPARGGADIGGLGRMGVPLFDLAPDATHYFDVHHTQNDTLLAIDREGLEHQAEAFARVVRWLAKRENLLDRVPVEGSQPGGR